MGLAPGLRQGGRTGTVTWSVPANSLPAGLTLDTTTGAITGTPTTPGTATFTVTATDAGPPAPPWPRGTATGLVTFFEGSTKLGRAAVGVGGVAVFTTSKLTPGPHGITGRYGGDDLDAPSTSAGLEVVAGT